jgi:hypothetical protein
MKKRLANFSLMVLLTLTLSVPVSVRADHFNEYNMRVDYSYTQPDECTGEDVLIALTVHIHQREVTDRDGGVHTTYDTNTQRATGVGVTSGTQYAVTQIFHDQMNNRGDSNDSDPVAGRAQIISTLNDVVITAPGGNNNLVIRQRTHFTVNANGGVTVTRETLTAECR